MLLGVDLGTSHTVAMLRRPDGRTRPLLFDGRPLLPSAVYLDTTGRLHVGPDALRLGHADPGRLEPHPKRHIDEEKVPLGDAEMPVADLLAAVLGAVAREAVATAGFLPPAVLTCPGSWGAPRREVLVDALARAGWPRDTRLIPEPVAAAHYFAGVLRRPLPVGSSLAVFDFGGGTLDVAVARNDGHHFTVTASGGDDNLGGLDLDAALVDHLGKSLSAGEPRAWRALTTPATPAQWRARREFWESVRGAKEMLSRSSSAPVPVPGVRQPVHLTRDELEAAADPLIRRAVAQARAVIAAAGLTPPDLAGLFLVGGSSRVPLAAHLLHSTLGIAPTVLEQPEFPVAEGATLAASATPDLHPAPPAPREAAPPAQFGPGVATAATPTPTPPTVPTEPPPITDTRADGTPITPTMPGSDSVFAAQAPPRRSVPTGTRAAPGNAGPVSGAPQNGPAAPGRGVHPATPGGSAGRPAPAPRAAERDDRVYAEPVDPWATGEAAAIAAGGHGMFPSSPAAFHNGADPARPVPPSDHRNEQAQEDGRKAPASRRRAYVLMAGAVAALLVIGGVSAWYFRPGYRALDYQSLGLVGRVPALVPVSYPFADAEVRGDRVYFASSDDDGRIGVVATDSSAGKPIWSSEAAGTSDRWESMTVLPGGVALLSATDPNSQRRLAVLRAKDGHLAWSRMIGSNDDVYYVGDMAVLADNTGQQLFGLRQSDGLPKWRLPNPKTDYGSSAAVFQATTKKDLNGPATVKGQPLDPDADDDTRIVQVSSDRSARVIDAETGKVLTGAPGVAGTDDEVVANDGRLIVRQSEGAQRIVSYDLGKLGEPQVLYTAPENGHLSHLAPCGRRICFVEDADYDAKSDVVTAVDLDKGGRAWKHPLAGVDGLVPVGPALLVDNSSQTTLLDDKGETVWTNGGVAARLDGGNLLEFAKPLSSSSDDPALAGQHLGDQPVQLGPLNDVRTDTCSWNKSVIACVADKNFVILKFAK
jgi:actin-like ATPase involved in cell morphogenesis